MRFLCLFLAALTAAGVEARPGHDDVGRVAVPDGYLAYDEKGQGAPIVLLHGAFLDRHSWDGSFDVLARLFRVMRYDVRPFGASSPVERAYAPTDDLLRFLDDRGAQKAHLIGHSFGGAVALDFALQRPDRVASLTLVSAPPSGFVASQNERQQAMGVFMAARTSTEAAVAAWLALPMWDAVRQRPEAWAALRASTDRSAHLFQAPSAPFTPPATPALSQLGSVKVPVLIVIGGRDTEGNRQGSDLLAREIPGSKRVVISDADHAIPFGWAAELNASVLDFLPR